MAKVKNVSDYPEDTKYLLIVLKNTSVHHEADQRSIDYPGHGYGAYTETFSSPEIYAYSNIEELSAHLQRLFQEDPKRTDFIALHVEEKLSVSHTISLD